MVTINPNIFQSFNYTNNNNPTIQVPQQPPVQPPSNPLMSFSGIRNMFSSIFYQKK